MKSISFIAAVLLCITLLFSCGTIPDEGYSSDMISDEESTAPVEESETTTAAETETDPPVTETETTPAETEPPVIETDPPAPETERETTYVLNTNTMKFHAPTCSSVKKIKEKNYGTFTGTRDEVIAKGFDPCGNCQP